jgi:hypothetical protein
MPGAFSPTPCLEGKGKNGSLVGPAAEPLTMGLIEEFSH